MADKMQRMITYLSLILPLTQAFVLPPSHDIRSVVDDDLLQLRGLEYDALLDPRDFAWNDPFTYGALESRDLYTRGTSLDLSRDHSNINICSSLPAAYF